ncbi:acyl-CoA dehydrogenase/oxidase, partial [Catenaria anguillulae PL171]|uniref:Acyl-coenzyme A oxidase n=1 Tax=Catenaria anguillulae PL171 TaxID=765915 RepID=A0A1Y2GH36_9FUNG
MSKPTSPAASDSPAFVIPPAPPGSARAQTVRDLNTARSLVSFPVDKLSNIIHGSPDVMKRKKELLALIESDPVFSKANRHHGSREDRMLRSMQMSKRLIEIRDAHKLSDADMWTLRALVDETIVITLHEGMFLPVLRSQCSPEQAKYWIPLAEQYKIIGSYAQTELAHGSNLSGLETTATYIQETDEFEIHSPDITAAKWWIGSLGVMSTHTLVQAKLIINNKDYGPHPFVVPIRDPETHVPFPGVRVGDIGPKMGFNLIDNGWILFHKYRIPRTNLLMRFSQVTSKGQYVKPPHAKLAYSGMVFVRTNLVRMAANALAKAATISVRYAAMRRQFTVVNTAKQQIGMRSSDETPVIMYPMVQARMFPRVAEAYATLFTAQEIESMYHDMMHRLESFDVSTLPAVHANSSALKSYCTGLALDGIEELRRACGGHGFLMSSGLPYLMANYSPNVTYEGENQLLTQQTARYLLKQLHKHQTQSETLHPMVEYLELVSLGGIKAQCTGVSSPTDWFNPSVQRAAFAHRAARLVGELAHQISHEGIPFADLNVECARVSVAHSQFIMVSSFHNTLHKLLKQDASMAVYPALKLVADVFALSEMLKNVGDFTEDGYLSQAQVKCLRQAFKTALHDMMKDAVGLVEAWGYTDYELDSAIGRSDGKIYEALLQRALDDPINQKQGGKGVAKGYQEYIRPLLKGERAPVKLAKL